MLPKSTVCTNTHYSGVVVAAEMIFIYYIVLLKWEFVSCSVYLSSDCACTVQYSIVHETSFKGAGTLSHRKVLILEFVMLWQNSSQATYRLTRTIRTKVSSTALLASSWGFRFLRSCCNPMIVSFSVHAGMGYLDGSIRWSISNHLSP